MLSKCALAAIAMSGAVHRVQQFTHFAVLDFEATCQEGKQRINPQEIIEFPVLLMEADTTQVDLFHQYVRPMSHPTLTEFCTQLTGITQDLVDQANTIDAVYADFLAFVERNGLTTQNTAIVTCGDWDLLQMWPRQAALSGLPTPPLFYQWINLKKTFATKENVKVRGMMEMLSECNLEHEGRHHSGIDDVKNIARCVGALLQKGTTLELTFPPPPPPRSDGAGGV
ncbi:hypothetical protein BSKO_08331 [Bryopsis sp. KO-2023]|nr:hypothetical protein BSKO_08331 [Bryopsis sp. KO-2023]